MQVDRKVVSPYPAAAFSSLATRLKMVIRELPIAPKAVMAATDTKAAIKPYSIAVAPDSSRKKFFNIDMPDDVAMTVQDRAYTSPIWYTP